MYATDRAVRKMYFMEKKLVNKNNLKHLSFNSRTHAYIIQHSFAFQPHKWLTVWGKKKCVIFKQLLHIKSWAQGLAEKLNFGQV